MPQENFTITSQHVTTQFNLAWSDDYADMLLQVQADDDITHRFLLEASSVTLREIADQFYKWADTLEQVEHTQMDKAMAEMKRSHDPYENYPQNRPVPHPGAPTESTSTPDLPAVLGVAKRKFKRLAK